MADEDYTFESTDAGASDTFPCEAGQIRKGGFIMIKGHPCKVCLFFVACYNNDEVMSGIMLITTVFVSTKCW